MYISIYFKITHCVRENPRMSPAVIHEKHILGEKNYKITINLN